MSVRIPVDTIDHPLFSLYVSYYSSKIFIEMKLHSDIVNTKALPVTHSILSQSLPSIFSSVCFNDANNSFSEEVRHTEVGHLFEHILLEYLCQLRAQKGIDAEYSGVTEWDWREYVHGTFHITLSGGLKDQDIFPHALKKSIHLLTHILTNKDVPHVVN